MLPELVVVALLVAFDSSFFGGAFHALLLVIRPRIAGFVQTVFDVVCTADMIEGENPEVDRPAVAISRHVVELDGVIG